MRIRSLLTVGFFISLAWIAYLLTIVGGEMMTDGITISVIIVTLLSVVFSILSWFLFSWASKNIALEGIMLSVIIGVAVMAPFKEDLGPMAGVLAGLVAGFAAYMIHQKITTCKNRPLMIGILAIAILCVVMSVLIVSVEPSAHIWDASQMWQLP